MSLNVFGCIFTKGGIIGDFGWMIQQPEYKNCLFIFNDNIEDFPKSSPNHCSSGGGNAVIRPYQCKPIPQASGIPTGSLSLGGGFTSMSTIVDGHSVQYYINEGLSNIRNILYNHKYDAIFYSAGDSKGTLGHGIFALGNDVINYITMEIHQLGKYSGIFTNVSQLQQPVNDDNDKKVVNNNDKKVVNNDDKKVNETNEGNEKVESSHNEKLKYYIMIGFGILFLLIVFYLLFFYKSKKY